MYTTLNGVEFRQADVVNQADAFLYEGHFFLFYDDEMETLIGGCFASSSLDALDILADECRLDHRMVCEDENDELDRSELGIDYDYLGESQDIFWVHDLHFVYCRVNMNITHILASKADEG